MPLTDAESWFALALDADATLQQLGPFDPATEYFARERDACLAEAARLERGDPRPFVRSN
jgi:hypothetical protein